MIWIGYTTLYREGGDKFARAARTLERERREARPGEVVRAEAVESKGDFVEAMERIEAGGDRLSELHFIGHGGMYGPMFRTTSMPEQFSPHEWRTLTLPFARGGAAFFHACRSGRWFAPFFARTFGVPAHGYHLYTTVSRRPDVFRWETPFDAADAPLYVVACPGKKSHGVLGSVGKYLGAWPVEKMQRHEPAAPEGDTTYDSVADLYDEVFTDIAVRADELGWIERHLLSFRYLDWDPVMNEIRRVLAPGGRLLVVDMVTAPLRAREAIAFARTKLRQLQSHAQNRRFARALSRLVTDPRWQTMLRYNPIRAEHELRWYLESRHPGRRVELLNVAWNARVLAFDSGPLSPGWVPPQSYP